MSSHLDNKKLLLDTSFGGISTSVEFDGAGKATFFHEQDASVVQSILDRNGAMYTHNDGYSPSKEWKRVASIPWHVIQKWKNELGVDLFDQNDKKRIYQLLDSSDYLKLRTAPGVLGKPKE